MSFGNDHFADLNKIINIYYFVIIQISRSELLFIERSCTKQVFLHENKVSHIESSVLINVADYLFKWYSHCDTVDRRSVTACVIKLDSVIASFQSDLDISSRDTRPVILIRIEPVQPAFVPLTSMLRLLLSPET